MNDKIKQPSAAGTFYTANKEELLSQLKSFENNAVHDYDYVSRAIVVPHAGYVYSGALAYEGFQYLDKKAKNIFIIAPSHYSLINNTAALSDFDFWSTPLGKIGLNRQIQEELVEKFDCRYFDEAFESEHSAEVQVPLIQNIFSADVKIVPLLVGDDYKKISEIIDHYYESPENVFVISSDLSHFHTDFTARKIDDETAQMIENKDISAFTHDKACGGVGVCALVDFARKGNNGKNYSLIRVGLINSSHTTGDTSRVVGYGSWFLCEEEKIYFIKKYFSPFLLDIARKSISLGLEKKPLPQSSELKDIAPVLLQEGACFVTLEINGNLRGCIGSILANRPLIDDVIQNAYNSAFSDYRFLSLSAEEFNNLEIFISLLSIPSKMYFKDEQDLLNQLKPGKDGLIIKDGHFQAVYLPSVWEQLPDKVDFLNSLKQKAGLSEYHFSKTFEAYRFETAYVH